MQKLIILTEQSLNDDNRGYYYNSLDINCPKIQKYLNNEIFINEYKDINLFSSPYLSCLELSTELIQWVRTAPETLVPVEVKVFFDKKCPPNQPFVSEEHFKID